MTGIKEGETSEREATVRSEYGVKEPSPSWRLFTPRRCPAKPPSRPGIEAGGKFLGAQAQGRGLGRVLVGVGVQGEQCAPPVEIELSKPNPTPT